MMASVQATNSDAEKSAIISEIEENLNANAAQKSKALSQVKTIYLNPQTILQSFCCSGGCNATSGGTR